MRMPEKEFVAVLAMAKERFASLPENDQTVAMAADLFDWLAMVLLLFEHHESSQPPPPCVGTGRRTR